jgi:hypothetical protein
VGPITESHSCNGSADLNNTVQCFVLTPHVALLHAAWADAKRGFVYFLKVSDTDSSIVIKRSSVVRWYSNVTLLLVKT